MTTPVEGAKAPDTQPMTPERWRAVDAILKDVLDRDPAQRDAFVAQACRGDEALRLEVASLLAAHNAVHAISDNQGGEHLTMRK